jgi:ferritin-like protein
MQTWTRAGLLRRGAVAALAASGAGALAGAASADAPADADLAFARLLVATELLADDFYTRALAAGLTAPAPLREARANERAHYAALAAILDATGQPPATAGDIDFSYPAGAFASTGSLSHLGADLETLQVGAYLGAADALASEPLRGIAARIAANEAQHLTIFQPFRNSFPVALSIEQASNALGTYTS